MIGMSDRARMEWTAGTTRWIPRLLLWVGVQVLWFWLWNGNWQALLEPLPGLRVTLALAILITPGIIVQQILWHNARLGWGRTLSLGFAISLALNGILGLVGLLTHQSLSFVMNGMWLTGAIAITFWFVRLTISIRSRFFLERSSRKNLDLYILLAALLAFVATAAAMWLAIGNQLNPDDYGYNAYLTYYQHAPSWSFNEILFGTGRVAAPRQWIAFLPLYQALIAQLSGLSGFRLLATYLPPLFVLLSAFATFTLARALGMRARLAFTAVTVQFACLLMATDQVQVGRAFFNRLPEDKAVVAFILAPVLFYLTVEYLREPMWRLLGLNMLVGLSMVWTHPTMTGLAYLIAGLYGALEQMTRPETVDRNFGRRYTQIDADNRNKVSESAFIRVNPRPYVRIVMYCVRFLRTWQVVLTFAVSGFSVLGIPLALRFVDTPYTRELGYDLAAAQLTNYQQDYLWIVNDVFYGLNPEVVAGLAFLLFFLAGLVALFQIRNNRVARYIVASLLVLVIGIVPLTGWLIGAAITAPHMDRLAWFTPFGIAIVFLIFQLLRFLKRRRTLPPRVQLEWAYPLAALVIMLAAVPRLLPPNARMIESLNPAADESDLYADYQALARQLDTAIQGEAFVVAENIELYNLVPGLTPKAHVMVFRNQRNMWVFGNLERDEIERRWTAWRRLIVNGTASERRIAILRDFRISFVVSNSDTGWVHSLVSEYPAQFTALGTFGSIRLYQFLP